MAKLFSSVLLCYFLCFHCCLLLASSKLTVSERNSTVKYLPGFDGPLPFEFETGYVSVNEEDDVQLFYYFVKSERNPLKDPLMLWLTGGPGCSSFSAFMFENGPLYFKNVEYDGVLPQLILNPNAWTKVASIIYVDLPVGTGFSYATNPAAAQTGDFNQIHHAVQFLRKWLIDHPEFLSNPVYIGGDSYSGFTVPVVVQLISDGNEGGIEPLINLQGYLLGNPITAPNIESNSVIPFAHGMGLISDELYESMKKSCGGQFQIPSNAECSKGLQAFQQCTSGLQNAQILEPVCAFLSPKPHEMVDKRRSLDENCKQFLDPEPSLPPLSCRTYAYALSYLWLGNQNVREALHIPKGTVEQWLRCNYGLPYTSQIGNSFEYHVNLSAKGYRALIYSGDHDMIVPFIGTQAWIRLLNYSIVDDWRPWWVEGQIAGYTRTYSNRMTFATIKGGGHTAPEYRPEECFEMFKRWSSQKPL